jgi:hypothetical protein
MDTTTQTTHTTNRGLSGWREAGVRAVLRELRRRDGLLFWQAAFQSVLLGAFLVGLAVDPRTLAGEPIWLKPSKFAASIALLAGTLAWFVPHVPVSDRVQRTVSAVVAVGGTGEILLIGGQAARGVESHFNTATAFDAVVYGLMGVTIAAVTVAITALFVAGWLGRGSTDTDPVFVEGILLGIGLFVVGSVTAATMNGLATSTLDPGAAGRLLASAGLVVAADTVPTVPVLGWAVVGDFRTPHFVGMHALQAVSFAGYLSAVADGGPFATPRRALRLAAVGYAAILTGTLLLAAAPALL